MNTNMHRVTEDLDDRFRQHEGDDLAAFSEDDMAGEFLRDVPKAILIATLAACIGLAFASVFN